MNWGDILTAAKLAQLAYVEDKTEAGKQFLALGFDMLGQYQDESHQAYVLHKDGAYNLAISGTRFGKSLGDLLDDAYIVGLDLGGGASVSYGAYDGMVELMAWALGIASKNSLWDVVGHSLGGQRALLSSLFIDHECIKEIYAFDAPKFGNDGLWSKLVLDHATCITNGSDLFFGWPFVSVWKHPPIPHIHLLDVGFEILHPNNWPLAFRPSDHDISMIVQRISQLIPS